MKLSISIGILAASYCVANAGATVNNAACAMPRVQLAAANDPAGKAQSSIVSDKFLDAVAHIESSGRSDVIGDGGKARGMFQLHRAAWSDAQKRNPLVVDYVSGSTNPSASRLAAKTYLNILAERFTLNNKRPPTPGELYACYNMGFAGFSKIGFELNRAPKTTRNAAQKLKGLL